MILLLGASGYIGSKFAEVLDSHRKPWYTQSYSETQYTYPRGLRDVIDSGKPSFIINAAGYTGKPNVDACELQKEECFFSNVTFPATLNDVCTQKGIPFLHVSSGCIYAGGKLSGQVVEDLRPYYEDAADAQGMLEGFTEEDEPNFSFKYENCSYYSGTKAWGETAVKGSDSYVCRLRIPFDQFENSRNYLTKLFNYSKYYDNVNSLSHRTEFVEACLDLIDLKAPYGIYNVTNPGHVSTENVIDMVKHFHPAYVKEWVPYLDDTEFYKDAVAPRSNCVLDPSKLLKCGIKMRPVVESLEEAIRRYKL
jgi:dTDP-4-dehydrorhamnose reductase